MSYSRRKNKPMAEINVVPYIDVMLVLLIIFMVTAPLLTEGVKVDLPQTLSNPIDSNEDAPEPFVLTVKSNGELYRDEVKTAQTKEQILTAAVATFRNNPKTDFLVRGDKEARYDDVLQAMVLLKQAGIETVSLVTQPLSKEVK